jgi:signal transduction histidine kinase
MENQQKLIQQLQKEIEYYKKQLNTLSGSAISRDYKIAEMNNMTKQMRTGFALIADLNRFNPAYHFEEIYDHFAEEINIQLQNDLTLILLPDTLTNGYFIPNYIKGYTILDRIDIKDQKIFIEQPFLKQEKSLLVNSQSIITPFIQSLIEKIGIPFFILTPIIVAGNIIAYIFTGRKKETLLFASSRLMIQDAHALEAIAGVIAAIKNQHEQFNHLVKERARISSDLHDEIGSGLTQIALLSDLIQQGSNTDNKVVNNISVIARALISNLNELVWSNNPENDSLDILCAYLRNYIYDYLTQSGIQFNIYIPDEIPTKGIGAELRRHIVMLVKESLNNIVKHSKATHVKIQMIFELDFFDLEINDNGIGIDEAFRSKKRNGLRNMEKRVNDINGHFSIQTSPNYGTSLLFKNIPYLSNTKM